MSWQVRKTTMEKSTKKQEKPRTDKHFPFASLIFV